VAGERPIPAVQAATTISQKLPVLVAELGAAFLCAELRITQEVRPDRAQYLAHWLKL
jgi:antirestriction protein ArdC